ncbi:MAG: hypothetical protein Lokiarch_19360 [Candidatus Lokiarchaeum sp. GC14_75]|nr:MAG: hypothetical protein Lokiarch_19360 [Candidatus Lokiarchaeum sp. GC14_75]
MMEMKDNNISDNETMEMKDNDIPEKRTLMQYFDLFFGLSNSYVMSFMILILFGSVILAILAHVFIFILIIGIILTFLKKNPFSLVFVYGTIICGAFYALPGVFVIPMENFSWWIFDYIAFGIGITEIVYIVIKLKDSTLMETYSMMSLIRERAAYDASLHYVLTDPEVVRMQEQVALINESKEQLRLEKYNKQHKRSWIISICFISVIGYYIAYFSSFGL